MNFREFFPLLSTLLITVNIKVSKIGYVIWPALVSYSHVNWVFMTSNRQITYPSPINVGPKFNIMLKPEATSNTTQ